MELQEGDGNGEQKAEQAANDESLFKFLRRATISWPYREFSAGLLDAPS